MAIHAYEVTVTDYTAGTDTWEYTVGGATFTNAAGIDLADISGYTPAATDIICVSPKSGTSVDGNVNTWIEWASSTWTMYISSDGHEGKFSVIIKTV